MRRTTLLRDDTIAAPLLSAPTDGTRPFVLSPVRLLSVTFGRVKPRVTIGKDITDRIRALASTSVVLPWST
jgi:hypothetical protein